jgi:hypothetical protein
VRTFRKLAFDADSYMLVAKVKEIWAENKQAAQKFDGEIYSLRKLSELEFRKQYQIKISSRFAALSP